MTDTKTKIIFLIFLAIIYLIAGISFQVLVASGAIDTMPPAITEVEKEEKDLSSSLDNNILFHLNVAQSFFEKKIVRKNGHVNLYWMVDSNEPLDGIDHTNSEAMSYYLLWTVNKKDKDTFDHVLDFIESKMLNEEFGYLMWRLDGKDNAEGDGVNIASDADLRAIKALLLAEKQWKDERYTKLIEELSNGLERIAITDDNMLAPYGGPTGTNSSWSTNEVWISYSDFTVFRELAERKGGVWGKLYGNMKEAVLNAQIHNGLYNQMLTIERKYGNSVDNGGYSINSLWIMVRSAESSDLELVQSAKKSLKFYKEKYEQEGKIYQSYDSSGMPLIKHEAPWVYALVGRAALNLEDWEFSEQMMDELLKYQEIKDHQLLGAIIEGSARDRRVGQFTMQESILTMQDYARNSYQFIRFELSN